MKRGGMNQASAWVLSVLLSGAVFGGTGYLAVRGLSAASHGEHAGHAEQADGHGGHAAGHDEHADGREVAAAGHAPAHSGGAHWSYEGASGPEHWAGLDANFAACERGQAQSPIDIAGHGAAAGHARLTVHYGKSSLKLTNNGHTIQANFGAGNYIEFEGERYDLAQFHFHNPSEHQVDGHPYPLEVHLVHKSAAGALAVVGVLFKQGAANASLKPLWQHLPARAGDEFAVADFNPETLLPRRADFFHYAGSLTTPPCSEGVKWIVMQQSVDANVDQLHAFNGIFPVNARPVQPLHGRSVTTNSTSAESLAH